MKIWSTIAQTLLAPLKNVTQIKYPYRNGEQTMKTINKIIVHCSATRPSMDIGVETITKWHTDPKPQGNGWSAIGYNYVITRDGELHGGRDLDGDGNFDEEIGAHAYGFNSNSIGICLVGGVDDRGEPDANFTFAQYVTLDRFLKDKREEYPGATVMGHRDLSNKPCPSFDVQSFMGS